jgi:hypothetical protein
MKLPVKQFVVATILFPLFSFAQSAAGSKPKLIAAYSKSIPAAKQSNPPMAGYFFVIKWQETTPPETFFWRGEGGWLSCNIEKACKKGKNYSGKNVNLGKVKKGTNLLLTPVTGGRFPIPAEIPDSARNTLFYKTAGSNWIALPVNKIAKK